MKKKSKVEPLIRDWILNRIRGFKPSDPLPTIRRISEEMDVSPTSVQKVVNQLKKEGLIDSYVGKGMFLRPRAYVGQRKLVFVSNYPDKDVHGSGGYPYPQIERLRSALTKAGCKFEIMDISGCANSEIPERIRKGGFAGIVLLEASDDHLLMNIQKLMIPVVSMDYDASHLGIPSVIFDNGWGAFKITKHLISEGHRRILAMTCDSAERAGASKFRDPSDELRINGYRYAMMDSGLEPEIISFPQNKEGLKNKFFALMARKNRPTALFIYQAFLAERIVGILKDGSYRIPEDISIVTVGAEKAQFEEGRKYSCVAFDDVEMGQKAAEFMLALLDDRPAGTDRHVVEARIVIAESTRSLP